MDKRYKENSSGTNNSNKYFYYPNVLFKLQSDETTIVFRKINKTKTQFFFEDHFNRRFYYRDVDLINLLVDAPVEIFDIFSKTLKRCIEILHKEKNEIHFSCSTFYIEENKFEFFNFCDMSLFLDENSEVSFLCPAGFRLKYIDIITLINLILHKEYMAEANEFERVKRLATKFYVLVNFYKKRDFYSELSKHGFEVDKCIEDVYDNNKKAKVIDEIFDHILV